MSYEFPAFFRAGMADRNSGSVQAAIPKEIASRVLEALRGFDTLFLEALGFESAASERSAPERSAPATTPASLPAALWNIDRARVLWPSRQSLGSFASRVPDPAMSADASPQVAKPASEKPTGRGSKGAFLDSLWETAKDTADSLGVSPDLLLAHAALESGWGKRSILDANGGESHNLFGIKAGRSWKGRTTEVRTTEYVDGVPQAKVETFRAYDSYGEAFADYAHLLKTRFADALEQTTGEGFGKALQQGGYATDPRYASKIAAVVRSVNARLDAG